VAGLNRTSVGLKLRLERLEWEEFRSGLNRTSVGLKLLFFPHHDHAARGPQSNQRGIETRSRPGPCPPHRRPQSNQRGIETAVAPQPGVRLPKASIEPAWD